MSLWPRLVVGEVAEMLRCGEWKARELMASGEIESALIAGRWTTSPAAVEEYVERRTREGNPLHRQRRRRRMR